MIRIVVTGAVILIGLYTALIALYVVLEDQMYRRKYRIEAARRASVKLSVGGVDSGPGRGVNVRRVSRRDPVRAEEMAGHPRRKVG